MGQELLVRTDESGDMVARIGDRRLEEIHLPEPQNDRLLGNIYLGRVENVLPGMQAAFVDIGLGKNSFLYVDDAFPLPHANVHANNKQAGDGEIRKITDLVKKGQQLVVQIFKEPSGTKGARVTMYPSLPGRYLVLLPYGDYVAVSRRIEDEDERKRLKELVQSQLPEQMGAIIRTVAEHADKETLAADLRLLVKKWRRIQGLSAKSQAPALLHHDADLLSRVMRDTNPADITHIVVGDEAAYQHTADVIGTVAPKLLEKLILRESRDLFLDYDIYSQLERALERKVWLKSGGYIIIDRTEALCAIDVNTGKYVGGRNLNDTVFKTNMEAVNEIARQLILRNIGGIVIIDFIDMDTDADRQKLLLALEEEMKKDRVRVTVLGMTQLGLVELTRKKIGHDLSSSIEKSCPCCNGRGRVPDLSCIHRSVAGK